MSYLVLARKWRPQSFVDMVGQQHIARVLTNAIQSGPNCPLLPVHRGSRRGQDQRRAHPGQGPELPRRTHAHALQRVRPLQGDQRGALPRRLRDRRRLEPGHRRGPPDHRERALPARRGTFQSVHHRRGAPGYQGRLQRSSQDPGGAAAVRQVHPCHHRGPPPSGNHPVTLSAVRLPPASGFTISTNGCGRSRTWRA